MRCHTPKYRLSHRENASNANHTGQGPDSHRLGVETRSRAFCAGSCRVRSLLGTASDLDVEAVVSSARQDFSCR